MKKIGTTQTGILLEVNASEFEVLTGKLPTAVGSEDISLSVVKAAMDLRATHMPIIKELVAMATQLEG